MLAVLAIMLLLAPTQVFNTPLYYTKRSTDLKPLLKLPVLLPIYHQPNTIVTVRKQKGPIPHQLLVPTNLHVIPISQHLVTQSHGRNITHQLVPILIPIHNHLVPVHDLTVIPLQRNHQLEKLSHYRVATEKKDQDEEVNQFRTFYGGYGTGLFFGGHGAGHGFYAYG